MEPDTAGSAPSPARGTHHRAGDRTWPRPLRVLVTLALLPVWAAVILASENDFGFIGSWFDPLMIGLMLVTVIAVWTATARTQR